jgi:hypothetical protein
MQKGMKNFISWIREYELNIALSIMAGSVIIIVVMMLAVALWTPDYLADDIEAKWLQRQAALEADPEWQVRQQQLHLKHGLNHIIEYAPQGAHYTNAAGEKCRFM